MNKDAGTLHSQPALGIIGGSGIYSMPGLEDVEELEIETPFGEPSAPVVLGRLEGMRVAFLARHGRGHHISPTEINYRANIFALKMVGVRKIISISACGSLREDYAPGEVVVPDQLFDFTKDRKRTFFEGGLVGHISVAEPFCTDLSDQLAGAIRGAGGIVHAGGSMITIEGPRFSTKAESNTYRSWGMSVIGMTTSPEAFLAREAEMCYAVMAHVTDYDVWHVSEEPVTVEMVVEVLHRNTRLAEEAIKRLARTVDVEGDCQCQHSLASALITDPEVCPEDIRQKLDLLVGKYLRETPTS